MENEIEVRRGISPKEKRMLLPLLLMPCLFIFVKELDNDIWFLLNSGRYVLANGIPHVEPFTIHQGWNFVMQQWLSGVIFWLTYNSFGEIGLRFLVMAFYILIIFFAYRLCMKISEENFIVSYATCFAVSILLIPFMTERPFIFSNLILLAEIYALESYLLHKDRKYLYVLPFLSVSLVNLHAAMWPLLFIILVPYLIDSFRFKLGILAGQGYEKKGILLTALFMLAAGFINPYGIDGMSYVFKSYGYPEINAIVREMQAANINSTFGLMIFPTFFLQFMVYCYCIFKKGKMSIRYILLTMGTAYMALSSIRNLSIFAICGLLPIAFFLKDYKIKGFGKETPRFRKFLIALLIVTILVGGGQYIRKSDNGTEYDELNATIDYILKNAEVQEVVLYTGYNDGGLAEFRGIPSYIDPRAEVFVKKNNKKEDVMKEYYQLKMGMLYYKSFLNKYVFTHIVVKEDDILNTYLPYDGDYEKTYSNGDYSLYTRIK